MTTQALPQDWVAPRWHADFGDVESELANLRCLATAILARTKRITVELQCPEAGLMFISISRSGQTIAEVYSTMRSKNSTERHFGIFLFPGSPREQEEYTDSVDQAVELLVAACKDSIGGAEIIAPPIGQLHADDSVPLA